ncbi:MAG TPA: hypothetical protein VF746_00295 [Longimicrobium sp.]
MIDTIPASPSDLSAAHVAVFALRASLPRRVPVDVDRVILPPDDAVLNDREAAAVLAAMRPVQCVPEVRSGVLVIETAPLSEEEAEFARSSLRDAGGCIPAQLEASTEAGGHPQILLIGRGETMVVDTETLKRSFAEYVITIDGFCIDGRLPDAAERERGIQWVVHVGRAELVTPEYLASLSEPDRIRWEHTRRLDESVQRLLDSSDGPVAFESFRELVEMHDQTESE